jgi:hypothetical protein
MRRYINVVTNHRRGNYLSRLEIDGGVRSNTTHSQSLVTKMMKLLSVLLVSLQIIKISEALVRTSTVNRYSTVLHSVGSDVLQRPEDENSPEFREYLKNLMKMQANRARSGHSSPSSGSSDAYFAKLTRLKIERQALKAAGLPEDLLDTGYTQDDYDAAM